MRNRRGIFIICAVLGLLVVQSACALNIVDVPVLRGTPLIDGRISPEEMKYAAVTSMTLVGSFDRPKCPTTVVMLVGQDAFYVGFDCEEPSTSGLVTKVKKENGPVFEDDSVQLVITPNREATRSNYFHFALNAAGVRYSNNMGKDTVIEKWQAAAQRTDKGWQAEFLIPFDSIKASADAQYWRANVARFRPARGTGDAGEISAWVDPGSTLHNYRRFGYLKLFSLPYPQLAELFGTKAFMEGEAHRQSASLANGESSTTTTLTSSPSAPQTTVTSAVVGQLP